MYCTLTPQVIPFSTLALICMRYEQATPWEYIDHVEHLNSTSALWQHQREAVRYVDVVWFVFHVQLLHIRFTQQNGVLHLQIYDETYTKTILEIGPPLI